MREIKFRVFPKEHMKKSHYMEEVDGYYLFLADGEIYEITEKGGWDSYLDKNCVTGDYYLMQFTGLHGKDKKPIFEGDVVKVTEDFDATQEPTHIGTGKVEFLPDHGIWYVNGDGQTNDGLFDLHRQYDIEVIGDIYTTPELLDLDK